jgi:hypothetical protein
VAFVVELPGIETDTEMQLTCGYAKGVDGVIIPAISA